MSELGRPTAPDVGATNHFSVELGWEAALKETQQQGKGGGVVKVHVQRQDLATGQRAVWNTCYRGMAKKTVVTDLTPECSYLFRYQFEQKGQSSAWSPEVSVTTTREPLYAANLHAAIKRLDEDSLEEVLKSGDVSPDVQNEDGFTGLMAAAKKPFVKGLEKLIEYGADVNFQNQIGKTALMIACTANALDSVQTLRKHNADYNIYDNGGCTAIHWAVDARSVKLIDWLGQDHADFNIRDNGHGGWTPLIRCANLHGDRDVALALMMNNCDINGTDNNGCSALHHAVMRRHFDLTQLLLQRRADPLLPSKEHTTPWDIANSSDDKKRIAQLMEPYVEERKQENRRKARQLAKQTAAGNLATPSTSQVISPVQ